MKDTHDLALAGELWLYFVSYWGEWPRDIGSALYQSHLAIHSEELSRGCAFVEGVCLVNNLMMTSSNGNIFLVTGPLCEEFTGHRWIPLTKASDAELSCFLWSAPEQTVWQTIMTPVIWDAQIMARRQQGDKPLSEPMMFSLLTHIYVTQHQWVIKRNYTQGNLYLACNTVAVDLWYILLL